MTEFVEWLTGTHDCGCGARYKVTVTEVPTGSVTCEKCGTLMDSPARAFLLTRAYWGTNERQRAALIRQARLIDDQDQDNTPLSTGALRRNKPHLFAGQNLVDRLLGRGDRRRIAVRSAHDHHARDGRRRPIPHALPKPLCDREFDLSVFH